MSTFNASVTTQAVGKRALVSLFCLFLRAFRVRVSVVVMMMSSLAQTSRYIVDVEKFKNFRQRVYTKTRAR